MDLLSRLLQLYPVDVALDHACRLGAPWTLDNPATTYGTAPYHLVTAGSAWLHVDGMQALHLHSGDVVVLPSGKEHTLSAGRHDVAGPIRSLAGAAIPLVVNDNPGEQCEILCGYFSFDPGVAGVLFAALPQVLHVRAAADDDIQGMQALIALLRHEHREPRLGSSTILGQLASVLFAMILRAWLVQAPAQPGMLALLSEPRLRRGLNAMLDDPAKQWSVDELAEACHLSRATFARHFVKVAGMTPGEMLMRIRMARAVQWLRKDTRSVAIIAEEVGYQSEAAFSRAFSRFYGNAPGEFRRRQAGVPALA